MANLGGAEVLVSLDDDEVVGDRDFLSKIEEDFEILSRDQAVFGLAGIYRNADGGVLLPEPDAAWAAYWPKMRWLNQALSELVLAGPRLKPTYLAFGGNLALSSALFRRLPFDPALTRGEDVDYVINARMWRIPFFLDHNLAITHLPPDKPHPLWLRLRQDLVRFCYTRLKLRQQMRQPGLAAVLAGEFKPYPGNFLGDDLEDRAFQSHTLLALEYLAQGDAAGARQTLANLALMQRITDSSEQVFRNYLSFAEKWQGLQGWLADPGVAARLRRLLWGGS
jgi:hypothetical protein